MPRVLLISIMFTALALAGCASGPRYDTAKYKATVSPGQAAKDPAALRGTPVLWGGLVINSVNLEGRTQIEMLGYPLDSAQRPDTTRPPQGRFLIIRDEYLETVDYAQGRLLTVVGAFNDTRTGQIGQSLYVYPVVNADQIHLWPRNGGAPETRFHFGVGVIFGR